MQTDVMLGLYLMTSKGVAVLKQLLENFGPECIAYVVTAQDTATEYDGHADILRIANNAGIPSYMRSEIPQQQATCLFAVSWRWLIAEESDHKLVVFHDSLLPRYRGFAPLISALVNGEKEVGVTALFASEEYDRGPIIGQESISIHYPITIKEAIKLIVSCYEKLAVDIVGKLLLGGVDSYLQDESVATYSLWRDEEDYFVDWSWDAQRIRRFVDAVGFPYRGAAVTIDDQLYRIRECDIQSDVVIENRTVGKVIFCADGKPVVVCGQGLLKILRLTEDGSECNLLPLNRFRIRFGSSQSNLQQVKNVL